MKVRAEVTYRGRVQGVGFRATVYRIADRFEVDGWVRNEPDGSVALVAEGVPGQVDAFLAEVARVMNGYIKSVDKLSVSPRGESGFEIRR